MGSVSLLHMETEWRCPETTALGIRDQTDRCKTYQDWKTLRGRFDRDIYSPAATAENSSPLGHMCFELNIFLNPTHPSYCALTGIKPTYTCRLGLSHKKKKTPKNKICSCRVLSSEFFLNLVLTGDRLTTPIKTSKHHQVYDPSNRRNTV